MAAWGEVRRAPRRAPSVLDLMFLKGCIAQNAPLQNAPPRFRPREVARVGATRTTVPIIYIAELENIDNRRFPEDSSRHKQTPFSSEERQRRARVRATARATTPSAMSSNENNPASASPSNQPGQKRAIPGLLTEIVITHILKKEHFPDPGDLAQLRVVSREMRDAVDATGRTGEELEDNDYVRLGCV